MEKYARVLVIIFFLCIFNLGLNIYMLSKLKTPVATPPIASAQPVTRNPSPASAPTTPPNIQSDLTLIKAEIRALRDSLNDTGLTNVTPEP